MITLVQKANLDKICRSFYAKGTLSFVQKESLANPLSNDRRFWLAMPLGAGFRCWVLSCRTIENKRKFKMGLPLGSIGVGDCR